MKVWAALSIKARIILASTFVFGIALVAFAMVIYHSSRRAEFAKLEARFESHADKLQTEIEEQVQDGTFPNLDDLNSIRTEGLPSVRRQVYDSANQIVLADSVLQFASLPPNLAGPANGPVLRRFSAQRHRYLGYRIPVEVNNHTQFELLLAEPLDEVDENLSRLRWVFYVSIPATLLLTGLAIFWITRRALRPLRAMTETARRISASNLSQRVDLPAAHDEVRVFAETLNQMIERLDLAFQSQKQFVSDASHELRTPLTVLNNELEYAGKLVNEPRARESLDASLVQIDRMSRLVEGLLLLTRIETVKPLVPDTLFRLDELIVETVQSLRWLASKRNVAVTPYIQEAVELRGNGDLLRRAVMNVIDNAVKYSPPNAEVTVRLEVEDNGTVLVQVRDNGPGISESDQQRVFERFFRGENARAETDGSGLGLAIAKKLVELCGGFISLESVPGEGTTVSIRMPSSHPR